MAQVSWSPRTKQIFMHELDLLLLRRHRLVELPLTPMQVNRVLMSTEAWARVKWLVDNGFERHVHHTNELLFKQETVLPSPSEFALTMYINKPLLFGPDIGNLSRFHEDSPVAPVFKRWVGAHLKIAEENIRAFRAVQYFINNTSTWLQVKKHWPELTATVEGMRKNNSVLHYSIPDMRELDASRARNLTGDLLEVVQKHSDHTVKTCLQALMLPTLTERMEAFNAAGDDGGRWNPFRTRVRYNMAGDKDSASYTVY